MILETRLSPNRSPRVHGDEAVSLVVVHTPEGGYDGTVRFIQTAAAKVSYHRLYSKDGKRATQLVPWAEKAWHAGAMNSLSDGLSIEGNARLFDLADPGVLEIANGVAERLVARGIPCQWTTDPAKGGFCRHGDLQTDRTDPTPDLGEWRLFVGMVTVAFERLTAPANEWPRPIPKWFWTWNLWRVRGKQGARPASAPRVIPAWAWRRALAFDRARRK
ncbi:MAG TPA: N-acetylmuramoyl-L-alanine amidase [Gaiellaceae bacterium]|nr:N-acetylmuramoyl-L-alanine amidase [Gaiellaceae bacterium]